MTKDYEILPLDEISKLREEIQELKRRKNNPEDSRLQGSIESLKTSVDRLRELFDDVQRDLLRDFEERERPEDLMKRLIEQNKIVADSLITLSGKINELTSSKKEDNVEQELKKIERPIQEVPEQPEPQPIRQEPQQQPQQEVQQQSQFQQTPQEPHQSQQEIPQPQQNQQQVPQQNQQSQFEQQPNQNNQQEPHPTSNMSSEELAKMYEVYKQQQNQQSQPQQSQQEVPHAQQNPQQNQQSQPQNTQQQAPQQNQQFQQQPNQNQDNLDFDKETYNDLQRRKQEFINKDKPTQTFEDDMPKPPQPKKGFLGLFKK